MVRLGTWLPFTPAAQMVAYFTGVEVGPTTTRRLTEQAGATYEAMQSAAVEVIEQTLPPAPAGPAVQLLSVDGAMVPLRGGEWAEVKTLALGEVQEPQTNRRGEREIHTTKLSYFSRLADHETFERLATVETHRRGTETAGVVCAVVDGADWAQSFIALHRPDAVRILDWAHAVEYLTRAAQAAYGTGTERAAAWLAAQRPVLTYGDPAAVLAALQALHDELPAPRPAEALSLEEEGAPEEEQADGEELCPQEDPPEETGPRAVITQSRAYLAKREAQIQYATFAAAGYPRGSGSVESANKLVVEARLKGAGMRWARGHVNPVVALRTVACSDRWAEAWPQISAQWRAQVSAQRRTRVRCRQQRRAALAPPVAPAAVPIPPPPAPTPPRPAPPAQRAPARRPAADHPWRRMSLGRPHCA